jgi:predicted enzyme related to lactoylglutathione lyase
VSEPRFAHGKICYIIMPSNDPHASSRFYADVFGWTTRSHDDGTLAFDDAVGQVSGMWVTDRKAVQDPGAEVHIMVKNADETERMIVEHGGTLVWRAGPDEREVYGTFRDPSGNLFGYYQQPGLEDA